MALIEAEEAAASSVHVEAGSQRPRRRRWPWAVGLGIIVLGFALRGIGVRKAADSSGGGGPGGRGRDANRAVPVSTAPAHLGDVPVYLRGIGTVQGFKTATVKSRVDGQLLRVNFKEGQDV